MAKITFNNKVTLNPQPSIARENKVIDDDINEIKSVVNGNDNIVTGLKGTILWTNPSPTNNWTSANATLSSSDYDVIEWYFRSSTTTTNIISIIKTPKGESGYAIYYNANIGVVGQRVLTRVDDTHYTIGAYANVVGTGGDSGNRLIPMYAIGYKTGLFN